MRISYDEPKNEVGATNFEDLDTGLWSPLGHEDVIIMVTDDGEYLYIEPGYIEITSQASWGDKVFLPYGGKVEFTN